MYSLVSVLKMMYLLLAFIIDVEEDKALRAMCPNNV